jgi:(2Fe-2S) ferredoxin
MTEHSSASQTPEAGLTATQGYYKRHIFFCLNQREGEAACEQQGAKAAFDHCKARIKSAQAAGPGGVRVNKAGCLDRCAGGPVAVVYPEAVWYTYMDQADVDEIIDSHLLGGRVVERLVLPESVGR